MIKNEKNTLRAAGTALYLLQFLRKSSQNPNYTNTLETTNPMKNSLPLRFVKGAGLAVAFAAAIAPTAQANFILTNSFSIGAGGTMFMDDTTGLTPLQILLPANVVARAANGLIVQAPGTPGQNTNITNIRGWINSGYNAGDWLGTGLTSTTVSTDAGVNGVLSVMMYDNTQINYANFAGATGLASPFNQVLSRITYTGDFDASGAVDGSDYGYLDAYLGGALLAQGDLNADGFIDGNDYGLLDAVLGGQVYGNLGAIGSVVGGGVKTAGVVPEPASAALFLSGAVAILGLRRRKSN